MRRGGRREKAAKHWLVSGTRQTAFRCAEGLHQIGSSPVPLHQTLERIKMKNLGTRKNPLIVNDKEFKFIIAQFKKLYKIFGSLTEEKQYRHCPLGFNLYDFSLSCSPSCGFKKTSKNLMRYKIYNKVNTNDDRLCLCNQVPEFKECAENECPCETFGPEEAIKKVPKFIRRLQKKLI